MTTRIAVAGGELEVLDLPGGAAEVVLLHEGLGSVGLWRGLPERLHDEAGARVVAFSRFGHGRSSRPPRPRTPVFMHEEARLVLPELLGELGIERPVLVGHSDGASIALIHAAEHPVRGVVAIAPHTFVEDICVAAIEQTRERFERGELRDRMARHHDDPDAAFWGWAGVWLDPAFRAWDLRGLIGAIDAPLLVIQGADDAYGTIAQVEAIERVVPQAQRLIVAGGHAPHVEQPEEILAAIVAFIRRLRARAA
jgi:pimeloyl-ACP methyl ester carboxylesterase